MFWVRADSTRARHALQVDVDTFLLTARQAWMTSQRRRYGFDQPRSVLSSPNPAVDRRLRDLHCHYDNSLGREGVRNLARGPERSLIRQENSRFSVCPAWLEPIGSPRGVAVDRDPDSGLDFEEGNAIKTARVRLIGALDSAARRFPDNRWFVGQLVRFQVDHGALDAALESATRCRTDRSWCAALVGYARHRQGEFVAADSAFSFAMSTLEPMARCSFRSIRALLPRQHRNEFSAMSCSAQDSVLRTFWWLADPMLSEPGNERRTEHFARGVRQVLVDGAPHDEYYDLRRNRGGDAIGLMRLRYGWPSYHFWGGNRQDLAHSGWLQSDAAEPYSAPEYSRDRVSVLPSWDAIRQPLTVGDDDFELSPPDGTPYDQWWPWEHFRPARGPIVAIEAGQRALFRRDSAALFVVSTDLRSPALRARDGERVTAKLLLSPAPDVVRTIGEFRTEIGTQAYVQSMLPAGLAIAGIELPARQVNAPRGRTRFGVLVPPALAAMSSDEVALSDLLLHRDGGDELPPPERAEHAIEQMLASTRLTRPTRVGVFWESYGFRAGDTVDVSVRLQRVNSPGKWRRLGMALRLADDPQNSVGVSWREPSPSRYARERPALRPTLSRQLTLDVRALPAGDYRLTVTMQRPGRAAAESFRALTIVR